LIKIEIDHLGKRKKSCILSRPRLIDKQKWQ
jgi:hypothetical protein